MRVVVLGSVIAIGAAAYAYQSGLAIVVPASSAIISEHELEELNAMQPEQQALRLLERTINHYRGAVEELMRRAPAWTGKLPAESTDLSRMTNTAYFSSDVTVREAALQVWLAQGGTPNKPESVDTIIAEVAASPDRRYFRLSTLGILAHNGHQPAKVLDTFKLYIQDADGATRSGVINGLALMGTEATIDPLLDRFRNDPSADLRERAACNLADSGLLSKDLRKKAVPGLIAMAHDPSLDAQTRKWVFQALREITGENKPDDPAAWSSAQ